MPDFFLYVALVFIILGIVIITASVLKRRARKAVKRHA
jgi:hypothetical protein